MAAEREWANLGDAIYAIRVLLNERPEAVKKTGGAAERTTDQDILLMIKAWLFQRFTKDRKSFDDAQDVDLRIQSLVLPRPSEKYDTRSVEGKSGGYADTPLRASASWDLWSGVFKMFNIRNENSIRPGQIFALKEIGKVDE